MCHVADTFPDVRQPGPDVRGPGSQCGCIDQDNHVYRTEQMPVNAERLANGPLQPVSVYRARNVALGDRDAETGTFCAVGKKVHGEAGGFETLAGLEQWLEGV